ncbi:MAG: hypothetical protein GY821_09700 [Gammaproteobacteria bacterium]|nr:hypothetical protein [Gammaproteobacteria bacterium]
MLKRLFTHKIIKSISSFGLGMAAGFGINHKVQRYNNKIKDDELRRLRFDKTALTVVTKGHSLT